MAPPGNVPYGKRLIPVMVDEIAMLDPERICFSFPRSANLADGFRDVNFRQFASAINKTAHFIQREIGRSSMFETVMYMGYPDVRHFIILVALMKTGHKVLFSSHRNSIAGHADLIRRTDCTILLHTSGFPVSGLLEKCRMESLCMPDLEYLLDDTTCDPYPYHKTFEEANKEPCLVIHTSGSTGLPKPVTWTHGLLATTDAHHLVEPLTGRPTLQGSLADSTRRILSGVPIYHGAGIASGIRKACFNNSVTVLGPPGLPSADTIRDIITYGGIDAASCIPLTLEEVATRPDVLEQLRTLKYVTYVGGHLSKQAGDIISKFTQIFAMMASTETSSLVQHATDREDFEYVCLHPTHNGVEMRPRGEFHELVFVKNAEQEQFQGVFMAYPELHEYSMSDLYSKHPMKPHHWRHEGRADDMIVFRNGWNFNPSIHQQLISSHPAVQNCVLVGTGMDKPAAIVELRSNYYTEEIGKQQNLLRDIWPKIEEANRLADTTGQLDEDYVIFAKKEKPFSIAGKGTVQRKATIQRYTQEIVELYRTKSG